MRSAGRWERALPAVLLVGAIVRLPFVFWDPRVVADPMLLADWAKLLAAGGMPALMGQTGAMVLYPPLAIAALWVIGVVSSVVPAGAVGPPAGLVLIKLFAVAGDIALAWLVTRLLAGRDDRTRVFAAAAIALNPAIWYVSAYWGQIDSMLLLLMVAAVAGLRGHDARLGWLGWAASVLWKVQAVTLAPVVAAAAVAGGRWRSFIVGAGLSALAAAIVTILVVPADRVGDYIARLSPARVPLNVTAFNAWYLVGEWAPIPGVVLALLRDGGGAALGFAAAAGVGVASAAAILRFGGKGSLALPAAVAVLGAFVFLPGMRERYLLGALPFLVLAASGWDGTGVTRGGWVAVGVLTATQLLNLVAVGSPAQELWANVFSPLPPTPAGSVILAAGAVAAVANVGVLTWGVARLLRPPASPSPQGA